MTRRATRIVVAVGSVLTAATLAGLAFYLGRQNLARADMIASVLSVLLNVVAVVAAVAGLGVTWWLGRAPTTRRTHQLIRADHTATVLAGRAQSVSDGGNDIDQEISASGAGRIEADRAQSVGRDDG